MQNPLELHKLSIDTQLTLEKVAEGQNLASCPQEEWMSEKKDPESLELFKSRKHKQIRGKKKIQQMIFYTY